MPTTLPTADGGLLARLLDHWTTEGWNPASLTTFRMEDSDGSDDDGDGSGDGDDNSEGDDTDDENDGDGDEPRYVKARQEAAQRRRELKPWKALGKELGLSPDEMRAAVAKAKKDSDDAPDPDALREEGRTEGRREADERANRRIVRSEVKVAAADLFEYPADAPKYLDLDKYDVDEDGEVDHDEITADLKQVLKDRAKLAKGPSKPKPDKGQGAREDAKPSVASGRQMFEERRGSKK